MAVRCFVCACGGVGGGVCRAHLWSCMNCAKTTCRLDFILPCRATNTAPATSLEGKGRANQYGQANLGRRACSLDTLTQPTRSTCSPQQHTLQRTPSLCAPAWKEGGGVRGLQGGWVRWIPCALAGSPQGRPASPLPAPPSIRGGVRAGQQDHIHFRDNLAHCVEVL